MTTSGNQQQLRFAFISSNKTTWGGSEELWSATAETLAGAGHRIVVFKNNINSDHPRVRRLAALGCSIRDLEAIPLIPRPLSRLIKSMFGAPTALFHLGRIFLSLRRTRPSLVLISQGWNLDGVVYTRICLKLGLPYALVAQKASFLYWPDEKQYERLRTAYLEAQHCFFVSEHNRQHTMRQLAIDLPRSSVVRNPFLVAWTPRSDWPDESDGLRFACVGRLEPFEKGQDILLEVLSRERWRNRPVSVSFFGDGPQRSALVGMVRHCGLENVTFGGHVDPTTIWNDHHALVLPSRSEGLPLVLVEAMLSGRVVIATDVAGNSEVISDEETGFIAATPTVDALDEAMERAWKRRHEWRRIGERASREIRSKVPQDPAADFADRLLRMVVAETESSTESSRDELLATHVPLER